MPYATVLAQVNDLDDAVFNQLPPQPPKKKTTSPSKQKQKEKLGEGSGEPSSTSKQSDQPQRSEKAQHILGTQQDHTPEEANVWADIMKLPGTKRNNDIADGYVAWLNKNYDSGIHEVNTYLFC